MENLSYCQLGGRMLLSVIRLRPICDARSEQEGRTLGDSYALAMDGVAATSLMTAAARAQSQLARIASSVIGGQSSWLGTRVERFSNARTKWFPPIPFLWSVTGSSTTS